MPAMYNVVPAKIVELSSLGLNEAWLEERLKEKPGLLGPDFEEVEFLDSQRATSGGGRLDLLLYDESNERRYVVELMLGRLDESHLVRTIEYWDIERRRYPAYDHVAVLVAEDVTSRFLNVIALMAGNIPIVVLQLNTLSFDDKLILHFSKVMDLQEDLRTDDSIEGGGSGSDRTTWLAKTTPEIMGHVDSLVRFLQGHIDGLELNYLVHYLGMRVNGVSDNFVTMRPKKKWLEIKLHGLKDRDAWLTQFSEAGLKVDVPRDRSLRVRVESAGVTSQRELIERALLASVKS